MAATGDKYVDEAIPLIASIRQFMPDVLIHFVTDEATTIADGLVDSVDRLDVDLSDYPQQFRGYLFRVLSLQRSPFERTVHMDCDTILGTSIYEMFHALQRFELLVGAAPMKLLTYGNSSEMLPEDCDKPSVPVVPRINVGVIGYNRSCMESGFFAHWCKLFKHGMAPATKKGRTKFGDQSVFRKAIWETNVNFLLLPPEFHLRTGAPQYLHGKVRIAHGRPPVGREKLIAFVNSYTEQRLYLPYQSMMIKRSNNWVNVKLTDFQ